MITYAYWFVTFTLVALALFVGYKAEQKRVFGVIGALILIISSTAYYFHFQQKFVKQWGGVMSVKVPDGQQHMQTTWKEDHMWIENYDPKKNECIFAEYSKGGMLEGKVVIKNCNPVGVK